MLPQASIVHHIKGRRLRLKIPSKKRDDGYFSELHKRLKSLKAFKQIEFNALTGSVLLIGDHPDIQEIAEFAAQKKLFQLETAAVPAVPLTQKITKPITQFSSWIRRFTHGDLELADVLFLGLMTFGIIEIIRGNFKSPPWYTAFWYAFGIFTKAIIDRTDVGHVRQTK
jgi:hypothetical protein